MLILKKVYTFLDDIAQNKKFTYFVTGLASLIVVIMLVSAFTDYYVVSWVYTNEEAPDVWRPFGLILNANTVVQEYVFEENTTIVAIEFMLANFEEVRLNTNQVYISINGEIVREGEIFSSKIENNEFYRFSFPLIEVAEGDILRIMITSVDGVPGEAITIWVTQETENVGRLFSYDLHEGYIHELSGEIIMRIVPSATMRIERLLQNNSSTSVLVIVIMIVIVITLTVLALFITTKEDKKEPAKNNEENAG